MAIVYVDFNAVTGTLSGTWTFTNGSTTVTGSGGSATSELEAGNYVRAQGGVQWYKVTSVTNDNQFEITPAFQQSTVSDVTVEKNANDGSSTSNAFCHLSQATLGRSPGDIIKVRAGQTHTYAGVGINFDGHGSSSQRIVLKGCDSSDDPWGDGSDVRPIIDFGDTSGSIYNTREYWKIQHLEIKNSKHGYGAVYWGEKGIVEDCISHDNSQSGFRLKAGCRIVNCQGYNNGSCNLEVYRDFVVESCQFDGGSGGTDYGIRTLEGPGFIIDTNLGTSTSHSNSDLRIDGGAFFWLRNVQFGSSTEISNLNDPAKGPVFVEDYDSTKLANRAVFWNGTIYRDTSVVRSGGADSSARIEPNSNCSKNFPIGLGWEWGGGFARWLEAGSHSCTVYIRGENWNTFPTADELWIEVHYYDGTSAKRAVVKSTDTLSANDTWTAFTVNFTLNSDSPCYCYVYLGKFETDSTHRIYVDIEPVWS